MAKLNASAAPASAAVRNSVRALIVRRNHVLLLRKRAPDGRERFALPGGGQDPGELLHETLYRECREEIDALVEIRDLLHVANCFKRRDGKLPAFRQQVEFIFDCRLPSDYLPRSGSKPDKHQVGVEWVNLHHVDRIDLRPAGLAAIVRDAAIGQAPVYLESLTLNAGADYRARRGS